MRLIDADEFHKELEEIRQEYREENTMSSDFAANVIETVQDEYLANAPTVDAVPVVRCRYCQSHHWEQEPCHGKTVHYCKKLNAEVTADFFCAAGKRKEADGCGAD